jgi:hypothetical protein
MKTPSGTFPFKLALLTAIAIGAAYAFRAFATATPTPTPAAQKYMLQFGTKATDPAYVVYVDLTGQAAFDKALCALKANGGQYDVGYRKDAMAAPTPIGQYVPTCTTASINTDKITTARLAQTEPGGESAANDPNAVYRVYSNSTADIKNVLDTFITPTPSPTPSL